MKILIEVAHPASYHLFKNMAKGLEQRGHEVLFTVSEKDVTLELLRHSNFRYEVLNRYGSGNVAFALAKGLYKMLNISSRFKPDIYISRASPLSGLASRFFSRPHIVWIDSDHALKFVKYTFGLIDTIITPSSYTHELGKKQVKINSFKELAYLHPKYFKPDTSTLEAAGVEKGEKFTLLRFVAWKAYHDVGQSGLSLEWKRRLIQEIEKREKVLISSETTLPNEFERYAIKSEPHRIHDLLYYADLYVGDGATMTTEASLLGTPAVYVSTLANSIGNFQELEKKYDLLYAYIDPEEAFKKVTALLDNDSRKVEWSVKRERLLSEKTDLTDYLIRLCEDYRDEKDHG